jgi:hypothetical protein
LIAGIVGIVILAGLLLVIAIVVAGKADALSSARQGWMDGSPEDEYER